MKSSIHTIDYTRMALFASLLCVSSYIIIPLPFSPVPVTAQSLAVMLAGSLLSPFHAFLTVLLFIFLGMIGLPVFAGGASGPGVLIGPTGGYLFGFLIGVVVISLIKGKKPGIIRYGIANLTGGVLTVYALGIPYLSQTTGMAIQQAFMVGGLPFLMGDLFKVMIAAGLAWRLVPHLRSQHMHG
jgi:biotin transport system substrate-specific component